MNAAHTRIGDGIEPRAAVQGSTGCRFAAPIPAGGWFEVHSENYFGDGGAPHHYLERVRRDYPLSLHGVGLSLGSADALNRTHLETLKALIQRYEPGLVSG